MTFPASVTIVDLPLATTLLPTALVEAVQTTNGVVESVSFPVSQLITVQQVIGPSVLGNAGLGLGALTTIIGTADQVLRVASNGSSLGFGPINLTSAALTGVMPVSFGGTGTSTLTANRVLIGNGSSALALSNIATSGLPLVGNGTSAAPGFAVLGVPGGGIGTGSNTPYTVLLGGTTATAQVQSLATTGTSGQVLTSQGAGAQPAWSTLGATQAQMEAKTATTVAVTPAVQQFHPSAPKAWVFFTVGTGTCSVVAGFNVTNVSYVSTGQFAVNFTVPFSNSTAYAALAMAQNGVGNPIALEDSGRSAAKFPIVVVSRTAGSVTDPAGVNVVCLGDQ